MSHFTQDPKKLQLFADYHAAVQNGTSIREEDYLDKPVECTLQKRSGDLSIYSEVFKGTYNRLPRVGFPFVMSIPAGNHDYYDWFRTSLVQEVEQTSEGYILHTLNSVYELKRI